MFRFTVPPDFFPALPQEVRELWLDPIAQEYSWPFQSLDDSLEDSRWRYVLNGLTLRAFAELHWDRKELRLFSVPFCKNALTSLKSLLHQYVVGLPTPYADLKGGQERFRACADFIRQHRRLPAPVVLLRTGGVFEVLDGHHRLAAAFHVGITEAFHFTAWVASFPVQ